MCWSVRRIRPNSDAPTPRGALLATLPSATHGGHDLAGISLAYRMQRVTGGSLNVFVVPFYPADPTYQDRPSRATTATSSGGCDPTNHNRLQSISECLVIRLSCHAADRVLLVQSAHGEVGGTTSKVSWCRPRVTSPSIQCWACWAWDSPGGGRSREGAAAVAGHQGPADANRHAAPAVVEHGAAVPELLRPPPQPPRPKRHTREYTSSERRAGHQNATHRASERDTRIGGGHQKPRANSGNKQRAGAGLHYRE